uniref:CDP-diacylglycerol--glycerol-3-phosphate 3-phosphatidyltransferase n=1 Tax=Bursaphelenchus xylophilus TaxID=6326 RepID=A0A1I7RRT6_BURXY
MTCDSFASNFDGIEVDPENIRFLKTPDEFYNTLIDKVGNAQNRIYMSALYLGTGDLEKKLVTKLESCLNSKEDITIKLLFDYLRGTRGGEKSSAGILRHLADRLEAYFFHTPDLRGVSKKYLPERVNEIVGLQHMKFFIFDDSIIISGANLSETYFTNRQDRYVVIENSPKLVDFFVALFDAVSSCSFQLSAEGKLEPKCNCHPFKGDINEYRERFLSKTNEVLTVLKKKKRQDEDIEVTLASGYLNLYDEYQDLILRNSNFPVDIVFASPEANGFYQAEGFSGYIPALYVYISDLLNKKINALGKKIRLLEYQRPGWSFHAKGIWINWKDNYVATVIGSSNYGYRSTIRDLEAQIMIVTKNEVLKQRINEEKNMMLEYTRQLDNVILAKPDHYVPWWVRYVAHAFKNFF